MPPAMARFFMKLRSAASCACSAGTPQYAWKMNAASSVNAPSASAAQRVSQPNSSSQAAAELDRDRQHRDHLRHRQPLRCDVADRAVEAADLVHPEVMKISASRMRPARLSGFCREVNMEISLRLRAEE